MTFFPSCRTLVRVCSAGVVAITLQTARISAAIHHWVNAFRRVGNDRSLQDYAVSAPI